MLPSPAPRGEAERAKRERATKETKTVKSIQIGNAMTRRVFTDEDHRGVRRKNNNGPQLSARFADLLGGARTAVVRARVSRRSAVARSVRRIPMETIASRRVRNNTNNRDR